MSDDLRLGLIVGGAVLVIAALLWRTLSRRGEVRTQVRRFAAAEPETRARAGVDLVDLGLSRAARPVLAHVASEPDSRVRLAIALAVGRRQWEPSNTRRVRDVREWASGELAAQGQPVAPFGPAVTRLSDMGGPRPPEAEHPPNPVDPATIPAPGEAVQPAPDPMDVIDWDPGPADTP